MRRKLAAATPQDTKGRSGCIITGAVFGIIFGLTFAFYGLPPILRHYYGEKHVAAGEAWVSGERRLEVADVHIGPDTADGSTKQVVFVTVERSGFDEGEPRPGRFRLEVDGVENWLSPIAQTPAESTNAAAVMLRFDLPAGLDAAGVRPEALHLDDPRVRFELRQTSN